MNRKLFALSILASLTLFGCASSASDEGEATCNNGVLEEGELCDGTFFAAGQESCPAGTTGMPVCTSSCTIDLSRCAPNNTGNTCGNSLLDDNEDCDGSLVREGKASCPPGTTGTPVCSSCKMDYTGCVADHSDGSVCNDGQVTGSEECDGLLFAEGKDTCPAETTGTPACTAQCTVDYSGCTPTTDMRCTSEQNSCDSTGVWAYCDTDGSMKTKSCADLSKVCDKAAGCVDCINDDVQCSGDLNQLMICKDNRWQVQKECAAVHKTCSEGEKDCVAECKNDDSRCTESGVFEICIDGQWLSEDCKAMDELCSLTDGCTNYVYTCDNNILKMCDASTREDCIEYNCTAEGALCDDKAGACVKHAFTCDGSKVKITDTSFVYDCASNASSTSTSVKEAILCNTKHGCTDAACKDDTTILVAMSDSSGVNIEELPCAPDSCSDEIKYCAECASDYVSCSGNVATVCNGGKKEIINCAELGWNESDYACNVDKGGCYIVDPCTPDTSKCEAKVFSYCIDGVWASEDCGADAICDETYGCAKSSTSVSCGNGYKEAGEACDGSDIYKTCSDFDPNLKWKEGGKPECSADCKKVLKGTCEVKDTETIKAYQFTNLDAIMNYMRQDDVALSGGFTTTKYSDSDDKNGWTLGIWGNDTSPAFDTKYLSFIAGSVSEYDSAYIKFDIKRTSTGPQKFVLGFYSDDKLISKTQEMEITTKYTNHQISIPQFSAISGVLSIRLSAYQSYSSKAGSLTIADVSVIGTKK